MMIVAVFAIVSALTTISKTSLDTPLFLSTCPFLWEERLGRGRTDIPFSTLNRRRSGRHNAGSMLNRDGFPFWYIQVLYNMSLIASVDRVVAMIRSPYRFPVSLKLMISYLPPFMYTILKSSWISSLKAKFMWVSNIFRFWVGLPAVAHIIQGCTTYSHARATSVSSLLAFRRMAFISSD